MSQNFDIVPYSLSHINHTECNSSHSQNSPQSSLVLVNSGAQSASSSLSSSNGSSSGEEQTPMKYIDPALRKEYLSWKKCPTLDRDGVARCVERGQGWGVS